MKRIRRILFASDFSSASGQAFDTALGLAKSSNATLTIVSVLAPVVTVPDQYLDAVTLDQLNQQARRWSAQQLEKLVVRGHEGGHQSVCASA